MILYSLIESIVRNSLFKALTDEEGNLLGVLEPAIVEPLIKVLSFILWIFVVLMIGQFLWNQGIHAVMPSIIKPIGKGVKQLESPSLQLIVTSIALSSFLA
jgi:cellobiose-specific phosphotransferase system component IIC